MKADDKRIIEIDTEIRLLKDESNKYKDLLTECVFALDVDGGFLGTSYRKGTIKPRKVNDAVKHLCCQRDIAHKIISLYAERQKITDNQSPPNTANEE